MAIEDDVDGMVDYYFANQHRLPMFVIYRPTTTDFPGQWIARLHFALPSPEATSSYILAPTLEALRRVMPPQACLIPRDEDDDPVIEESWA